MSAKDSPLRSSTATSQDPEKEAQHSGPVAEKRLLLVFMLKKVPPIPDELERQMYPWHKANPLLRLMFWWLDPIMLKGYKRTLTEHDLFKLDDDLRIEPTYARFKASFDRRIEKAEAKWRSKNPDADISEFKSNDWIIVLALLETFKWQYLAANFYKVMSDIAQNTSPLVLRHLINFVGRRAAGVESSVGPGVGYAICSSVMVLLNGLFVNHFFHNLMLTGAQVKGVLTKALLDKSFLLTAKARHQFPNGKITALMGADLARIDFAVGFQPFLLLFPIPLGISIGLLIYNIGVSALAGIAVFVLATMAVGVATKKLISLRKNVNVHTDRRVGAMREILNSMKMIKFYAWEEAYEKSVHGHRNKEMNYVYVLTVIRNSLMAFAICSPFLSSLTAFLTMYGMGRDRQSANVFLSVSLFSLLTQVVMMVPIALSTGADGFIAMKRVKAYLLAEEVSVEEEGLETDRKTAPGMAIELKNASFKWESFVADEEDEDENEKEEKDKKAKAKDKEVTKVATQASKVATVATAEPGDANHGASTHFPGLNKLNFSIAEGEFIIVTGLIGTGKLSLLQALAGFMSRSEGTLASSGSLLLCGYPWIQNASVRDNITFGLPYNLERYHKVISSCALEPDLEALTAGDQTEIGERGITLSGGQKARINLARAVYADHDIILLDDVLSAVDARVGKHIMTECLAGMLEDKTRVLATHQLSLIGRADRVVFLNGDGSVDVGTVNELKARNKGFVSLMEYSTEEKAEEEEVEAAEAAEEFDPREKELELVRKQTTKVTVNNGKLGGEEERAVNSIAFGVYKEYVRMGSGWLGWAVVPVFCVVATCATFCMIFTNTWLSFWTGNKFPHRSDGFYIGIYVMFTVLTVILVMLEFSMLAAMCNNALRELNLRAISRLLHTPMSFLDTTPMGRVINRFTKDTDVLDNEIGEQVRLLFFPFAQIVGVAILCIIYLPWFAIAVPFLVLGYVCIANYYQALAREVKRLEAVQRLFVYNNFNETLGGMATIKAYKAQYMFMERNNKAVDRMNEAYFLTIANQRWLSVHLDLVASSFALLIAMLCVTRQFKISAASSGLLLSYVLQIAGLMSLLIRALTQVENEMNSVERLLHYATELPQEAAYTRPDTAPVELWPQDGAITFNKVQMAYRPELPLVLKGLTMDVRPREKIGICGRTGAGKSSIMTALYRVAELAGGAIEIDGVDIATLGLKELRSKLSIIPQDPVLFQGSIRRNLDPFGESSDERLWDALRRSGLIEGADLSAVKKQVLEETEEDQENNLHKFHLDQQVEDEGSNFSLGERQLLALARALVRNLRILILDEATSLVDYETDAKIQLTIANEFNHCTILCIAHRLKTILNYDRILVLEQGEIEQFDTPRALYAETEGIFRQMCDRSNISEADF